MSTSIPRFMVAAPSSGSGKTVVTCALLRALARRGLACAAFKCGPDYIDPLFHRRVVGACSGNLDGFFTDAPTLRALLARGAAGADVAVLEGVMGFYDGMAPGVADASSYQVARDTETPVVLVVNGRGASLSLAAVIRGIAEFLPCANVRGVVLNKTSAAACAYATPAIEKHTGVAVLGNIPADEAFSLESRHLGLVTADEVEQLSARIGKMAELVEKSVDVDRLLEMAATAPDIREEPYRLEPIAGARPIVAVARDEAFSFYYEENLRALEDLGCELAFFSPLCDSELPRGTSALYLGGGYPELHARQLSENAPMREVVRRAVESGMPTIAECGGFLYLQREIADSEGRRWPVAGALEGASENGGRLSHFGYVELTSQRDGLYGPHTHPRARVPLLAVHLPGRRLLGAEAPARQGLAVHDDHPVPGGGLPACVLSCEPRRCARVRVCRSVVRREEAAWLKQPKPRLPASARKSSARSRRRRAPCSKPRFPGSRPQTSAPVPPRTPRGTPSRTPWGDWATLKTPSRVSPQLRGARWPSFPVRSRYSSPTTGSLPKACRKAGKM